jgi:hypothetical protein
MSTCHLKDVTPEVLKNIFLSSPPKDIPRKVIERQIIFLILGFLGVAFFNNCFGKTGHACVADYKITLFDSIHSRPKNRLLVSFFNEAVVPSFSNVFKAPLHPGFSIGRQHILSQLKNHQLISTVNLGFYHHRLLQNGLYMNTELGYGVVLHAFSIQALLGIGYLRTFFPGKNYEYSNGNIAAVRNTGKGHVMPSFSLQSGYTLKVGHMPVGIFIQYQVSVETNFSRGNDIPYLPQACFYVGSKWPINF